MTSSHQGQATIPHLKKSSGLPFLEQSKIIAFHQLKAAAEVRLNPAINILQSARNHSAFITDALVDRQHVIVFEPFDDHEQHRLLRSFSTDEAYPEVAARVSCVRNAGEDGGRLPMRPLAPNTISE
jgi:hypothetical protein